MPNPASIADVEARWRPLTPAERAVAQAHLDDAWFGVLLRARPLLETQVANKLVPADTARFVVCSMVLRFLKNPDGKGEESIDDYRYKRSEVTADGLLYATDAELAMLVPPSTSSRKSVRLVAYGQLS